MFYTWGVSDAPQCSYNPHTFICPHTFVCSQGCTHPPYAPYSSVPLFLEALHVVWGCNGVPFVLGHPPLHHPCLGVPPLNYTPHTQSLVPCASVCFRDISMLCGHFPSVKKGLGMFPHQLGGWGIST